MKMFWLVFTQTAIYKILTQRFLITYSVLTDKAISFQKVPPSGSKSV